MLLATGVEEPFRNLQRNLPVVLVLFFGKKNLPHFSSHTLLSLSLSPFYSFLLFRVSIVTQTPLIYSFFFFKSNENIYVCILFDETHYKHESLSLSPFNRNTRKKTNLINPSPACSFSTMPRANCQTFLFLLCFPLPRMNDTSLFTRSKRMIRQARRLTAARLTD